MTDERIVQLFFARDEEALKLCEARYGKYCHKIAKNILADDEDAHELVNDTLAEAWRAIPPARPRHLLAFLSRITRNLALNRLVYKTRDKRKHAPTLALDELDGILGDASGDITDEIALKDALNRFLRALDKADRTLFLRRYWQMTSIETLAKEMHLTKSNVAVRLYRLRERLKAILIEDGILTKGD